MKSKKISAFTLAEVLVTLMIIGVIAAMTIPTLQQNTRNNEMVAGCLKAFSTLSQAIDRMKPDYGPVGYGTKWNDAETFWKGEKKDYKEGFVSQFNYVSVEDSNNATCYAETMKKLNGGNINTETMVNGYTMHTTDGMCIMYRESGRSACAPFLNVDEVDDNMNNCLGRFLVDVNGEKGPNRFGRDIYYFALYKGSGVIPAGSGTSQTSCTRDGSGYDCAAKVIREKKIEIK